MPAPALGRLQQEPEQGQASVLVLASVLSSVLLLLLVVVPLLPPPLVVLAGGKYDVRFVGWIV